MTFHDDVLERSFTLSVHVEGGPWWVDRWEALLGLGQRVAQGGREWLRSAERRAGVGGAHGVQKAPWPIGWILVRASGGISTPPWSRGPRGRWCPSREC